MIKKVYTTRKVGQFCGVDLTTVINWEKKGKIKAYKTPGGHRRIRHEDLIRFMIEHSIPVPDELRTDEKESILIYSQVDELKNLIDPEYYIAYFSSNLLDLGYKIGTLKPRSILIDEDAYPGIEEILESISSIPEKENIILIASTEKYYDNFSSNKLIKKPFTMEKLKEKLL